MQDLILKIFLIVKTKVIKYTLTLYCDKVSKYYLFSMIKRIWILLVKYDFENLNLTSAV